MTMNKKERKASEKEKQTAKLARKKKRLTERKRTRSRKRDRLAKQNESQSILYSVEAVEDEEEEKFYRWFQLIEENLLDTIHFNLLHARRSQILYRHGLIDYDEHVEEENDKCPICFDEIEKKTAALQCSGEHGLDHYFHEHCLKRWIISQRKMGTAETCPICRGNLQYDCEIPSDIHDSDDENWDDVDTEDSDSDDSIHLFYDEPEEEPHLFRMMNSVWAYLHND